MKKKKRIVYNLCLAVLICIFLGSAGYLAYYFLQSKKSEDQFQKLEAMIDAPVNEEEIVYVATDGDAEPGLEFVNIDGTRVQKSFASLYRENHDFIGWLSIEDTNIDYPVMQTPEEEEYYIHRDFYGEYSSAGTLFVDLESNVQKPSDNILIYGHNMKTGKMFHDLLKYENESFYKNHKYIQFDTIYEKGIYQVMYVFRSRVYREDEIVFKYYQFIDANGEQEFNSYMKEMAAMSFYDTGVTAEYGDQLLTLSTCDYQETNGRFVVVAKKIAKE